jgi:hypothetical protein
MPGELTKSETARLIEVTETQVSSERNNIAQALWYVAPGRTEVREEVLLPPPNRFSLRARAAWRAQPGH